MHIDAIQMAKYMKKCLISLAIGEIEGTTTMRYYYKPTWMAKINETSYVSIIKDVEPLNFHALVVL